MNKPKTFPQINAEDLFTEALKDTAGFSQGALRLISSGLSALRTAQEGPLNPRETQAVKSMIEYVAYSQEVDEGTVATIVTAQFNASEIEAIRSRSYNDVIAFLVDLQIKTILN